MKISIIIPVYNVESYVKRCLDSVCAQSYANLECVLVDDCGTDGSMEVVKKCIGSYAGPIHFKTIHHHRNQGLSAARNTGISVASGEYIYFLDSDDTISCDCIETLVGLAERHPDADFIEGNVENVGGGQHHCGFLCPMPAYSNDARELDYLLSGPVCAKMAWNILLRRDFVIRHRLFFPVGMVHEDMYWRYFLAKAVRAAAFTNKKTYFYHWNEGSITASLEKPMLIKRYQAHIYCAERFLADINADGCPKQYQFLHFATTLFDASGLLCTFGSLRQWGDYWVRVMRIAPRMPVKTSWTKCIYVAFLLPPLCFVAGQRGIRWRIQQRVLPRLWTHIKQRKTT